MIIKEEDYLAHYGILRKSGRYPWGSGGDHPHGDGRHGVEGDNFTERSRSFLGTIAALRKEGISDTDIAKGFEMTTTEFRNVSSLAKNEKRQSDLNMVGRLKDKGYANTEIAKRMNISEAQVRALLKPGVQDRLDILKHTTNMLRDQVAEKKYIDIGVGVENQLQLSREKLDSAIFALKDEGYKVRYIKTPQLTNGNKLTNVKVLIGPETTFSELVKNKDKIQQITAYTDTGGRSPFFIPKPPLSISSKRVGVRYGEDGGGQADGVIYVRHGVKDVTLDGSPYAQVRIAVDGTHYLKGMAMYKDDMPDGVDLVFNTPKNNTGNKLDAMKPMKTKKLDDGTEVIDLDNPFSASIKRQVLEKDKDGNDKPTSVMNIINEAGDWEKWSRSLSSQFLSKQSPTLIKSQLDMKYDSRAAELESIKQLTNPSVRRLLLSKFAESTDSSAVHLDAAALPRQGSHVILPLESMKENEIYAPKFRNGEQVVLIRHPHAGVFEIPQLTVNNNHPESKKILGRSAEAADAVVIHPKVAQKLSGADFDGDTVLVIPNNMGKIKTAPSLEKLKNFDPQKAYPEYPGMKIMTSHQTQVEMGVISNLITDMTIQRAGTDDLSRAVRHSMVVIDAEKKHLDFRQSAIDHNIKQLREKYQSDPNKAQPGGAATLLSRSGSQENVPLRRPRIAKEGGPIDKVTGELKYSPVPKDASFIDKNGKLVIRTFKSTKGAETNDAHSLVSKDGGTAVEKIYADHANKLKGLANQARLEMINTPSEKASPSAKVVYADQIKTLDSALNIALQNKPRERQAQLLADAMVRARLLDYPDTDKPTIKKLKTQALFTARNRTGAGKQHIEISDEEWKAIQAGAISNDKLTKILQNSNLERVRQLATPKTATLMTSTKKARAQRMITSGFSQAEIADALGVSVTTLRTSLKG